MKIKCTLLLLIICIFNLTVNAQKVEKEKSIKRSRFPEKALNYLNQHFSELNAIKYYREKTKDSIFYESKFKSKGDTYSVKFTPDGNLYDIEQLITREDIPDAILEKIKTRFNNEFKRWKIEKIQLRQRLGRVEYEIIVDGKAAKQVRVYEYHFSESGKFMNKQEVESRFTDIMFF